MWRTICCDALVYNFWSTIFKVSATKKKNGTALNLCPKNQWSVIQKPVYI